MVRNMFMPVVDDVFDECIAEQRVREEEGPFEGVKGHICEAYMSHVSIAIWKSRRSDFIEVFLGGEMDQPNDAGFIVDNN